MCTRKLAIVLAAPKHGGAMSLAAWEHPSWGEEAHERHAPRVPFDADEDDADDGDLTTEEAGAELYAYIVLLKRMKVLTAKHVCVLCFWCAKAGCCGMVEKLAYKPSTTQTGHFSRHFDAVVGCRPMDRDWYRLPLPLHNRQDNSRTVEPLSVVPPHEALADELLAKHDSASDLAEAVAAGDLPESYKNHPTVVHAAAGTPVYPLALYLDGISYARRDSVLGIFAYNILSGIRHLICAIRKAELCRCGCRGWCTLQPLFRMLDWSASSMCEGRYPLLRHDGTAFDAEDDGGRASLRGLEFGWKAVILMIKADWAEFSGTLGFPSATASLSPCPFCFCSADSLWDTTGYSRHGMPSGAKHFGHYLAACQACEFLVQVRDQAALDRIKAALFFDRRPGGNRGRCLCQDLPEFGLVKGDRLEPTLAVMDPASIDSRPPPFELLFWRVSAESITKHRNPLFNRYTGVTPERCLAIDWLHALSLGVVGFFVQHVFHELLHRNAFQVNGPASVQYEMGIRRLKAEVCVWYTAESRAGRHHNRLNMLTLGMLGSYTEQCFKLHGAETNGLLHFCFPLLARFGATLGDQLPLYERAAGGLRRILELIKANPRKFSTNIVEELRIMLTIVGGESLFEFWNSKG